MENLIKVFTDASTISYYGSDNKELKHLYVGVYVIMKKGKELAKKEIIIKSSVRNTNEAEAEMIKEFFKDYENGVHENLKISQLFTDSISCTHYLNFRLKALELGIELFWINREKNIVADLLTTKLKNKTIKTMNILKYNVLEKEREFSKSEDSILESDVSNQINNYFTILAKSKSPYVKEKINIIRNNNKTLNKKDIQILYSRYTRLMNPNTELTDKQYFKKFFGYFKGDIQKNKQNMLVLLSFYVSLHHKNKQLKTTTTLNIFNK